MYCNSFRIIALIAIFFSLSGCIVSKKKYEETESKRLAGEFRENTLIEEKENLIKEFNTKSEEFNEEIEKLSIIMEALVLDTVKLNSQNREYMEIISAKISEKKKLKLLLDSKIRELDDTDTELRTKSEELESKNKKLTEREKTINELSEIIQDQKTKVSQLLNKVQNALVNFENDELTIKEKNGMIYIALSDKLLFKSGSADVEKKGKKALEKLAEVLIKNPDIDIIIEGHTDSFAINTPRFNDNWDLSVIRATSVVRILTEEYHISSKQVVASGRGEHFPIATNKTEEGRSKNRRTEIILSPKIDELYKLLQGK